MSTTATAETQYVNAENGVTFAYRRIGAGEGRPLVMHIHFRANMDFWDPLLIDNIASQRPVIIFDQSGVGRSDGDVVTVYQEWADNVIAFVEALGLKQIDLFGFSMGGCCVQMVALTAPHLIHKLIIAGSGPSEPVSKPAPSGIVWPRDVPPGLPIKLLATAETRQEIETAIAVSFFPDSHEGRAASKAYFSRIRHCRRDKEPYHTFLNAEKTKLQRGAYVDWSSPNPRNSFSRLGELKMPVLILNGDDDLLIPTSRSYELLKGIDDAQLILYPRAGHGFLWQYAERVARDVNVVLGEDLPVYSSKM